MICRWKAQADDWRQWRRCDTNNWVVTSHRASVVPCQRAPSQPAPQLPGNQATSHHQPVRARMPLFGRLYDSRVWWPQNEGVRPCCDCWWPCCRSWRSSWGRPSLLPSSRPRPRPSPPPQSPHSPPFTGGLALTPHPLEGRTTTLIRQVLSITRAQCNVVVETFGRMRQIPTKI